MEVCLVGSTGLVGSHILSTLTACSAISSIYAYTRRQADSKVPTDASSKIKWIRGVDSSSWPASFPSSSSAVPDTKTSSSPTPATTTNTTPSIFISALGTTARIAGGFAAQRKIDYDLNLALARAAHAAGATVYTLISTSGASPKSMVAYSKMKGELDEAVQKIGFRHVVILKPGLLVGDREDSRPGEFAARKAAGWLGRVSGGKLMDGWAVEAGVVARAAVRASVEVAREGSGSEIGKGSVRVLSQADIVRLGKEDGVL